MKYGKSYCEEKEISTSALNEAQRTLYYIAENMKMDKSISEEGYRHFQLAIKALEQQPKTGHWIEVAKHSDGRHEIKCSECESHIFDRGHANSYVVKEKYKYCPTCGARMREVEE